MVTYAQPHLLLRFLGTFGTTGSIKYEEWGASVRVAVPTGTLSEASKGAFLETIQASVASFHTSSATAAHNLSWLAKLTAAYIGTDGKYVGGGAQPTTEYIYATPFAGFSSNLTSWDVARTYTLRTSLGRGRGSVGRFYWPCAGSISADGRWTTTDAQAASVKAKEMLDSINSAAKATWPGAIGISVISSLGAAVQAVNRVEVGRAPDTQRRRTKSLIEDYQGNDLAGALARADVESLQSYRA